MTEPTATSAPTTTWEEIQNLRLYSWDYDLDEGEATTGQKIAEHLADAGDLQLCVPSWDFDLIGFWVRKETGQILYGLDSGCSCPSPWENTEVSDLKETTLDRVSDLIREHATVGGYDGLDPADLTAKILALRERLAALGGK